MAKKLKAKTIPISELSETDHIQMFAIFETYYENTKFENFKRDLLAKDNVIILSDESRIVKGFSTLVEFDLNIAGKKHHIIYSGDTIISTDYRGTSALTMEFLKNILKTKLKNLSTPVWWFLVSKGYKTYLLLANNFNEYFPRYDKPTTREANELIKFSADKLFPGCFDSDRGVIGIENNEHEVLKNNVAPITDELKKKFPKINFFDQMNPNWSQGEELACIGRVDLSLGIVHPLKVLRKACKRKKK